MVAFAPPARRTLFSLRRSANIVLVLLVFLALFILRDVVTDESETEPQSGADNIRHNRLAAQEKAQLLDTKYLSRLVADPAHHGASHRALAVDEDIAPSTSNYSATIVMGRMSDEEERVQWVFDKLLDIQDPQIYIVDNPNTSLLHLEHNHGREAAIHFSYIVDRYDDLPDVTFFWHNDEIVWHNNLLMGWNSTTTINRMDRANIVKQGYVPSRCDQWPGCPNWIRFDPSTAEHRLDPHRLEALFNPEAFHAMFGETEFPPLFGGTCCSQFAVSRDGIRRHPKAYYENLLAWTMDNGNDDAQSGRVFEYTWPYIFTGRGTYCPSMQDCYCKTYNFCMENYKDVTNLEQWNSLRTRREEVQWQLTFMEEALETRQNASEASGATSQEIVDIEDAFRPELDRLSSNLANLTHKTWQAREDIIHYWKLGAPPVGW